MTSSSATPPLTQPDPGARDRLGAVPPEAFLALSILSIQVGSALATTLFEQMRPSGTALLKTSFTALALGVGTRAWRGGWPNAQTRLLSVYGAVIAAMFLSNYEALARLPMGVAATIGFLGPLSLAVAQARRLVHALWAALAVVGIVLLSPDLFAGGWSASVPGLCWAIVSALSWASFVVLSPRVARAVPGLRGLALAALVATAVLAAYAGLGSSSLRLTGPALATGFAVALLTAIVPISLEFLALRRLSSRTYGVIVSTEPAVAAVAGAALLGQALGWPETLGIGAVCAASLGASWTDRRTA